MLQPHKRGFKKKKSRLTKAVQTFEKPVCGTTIFGGQHSRREATVGGSFCSRGGHFGAPGLRSLGLGHVERPLVLAPGPKSDSPKHRPLEQNEPLKNRPPHEVLASKGYSPTSFFFFYFYFISRLTKALQTFEKPRLWGCNLLWPAHQAGGVI